MQELMQEQLLELPEHIHLLAVLLSIAAAFFTDAYFFKTVRSGSFTQKALKVISLSSKVVWLGLVIIIASGMYLYLSFPLLYMDNPQFWAKMTVVIIILLNGLWFHFYHLPFLRSLKNKPVSALNNQPNRRNLLLISGAFSSISWIAAFILGKMLPISWPYAPIMGVYLLIVGSAAVVTLSLKDMLIPSKH